MRDARRAGRLTKAPTGLLAEREVWDRHWAEVAGPDAGNPFGRISSFVRRRVFEAAVGIYAGRFFPGGGLFLEAGCGTAESSRALEGDGRRKLGVDLSLGALASARRTVPEFRLLQADIRRLPVRDTSVDGLWNLGVMEHFLEPDGDEVLREFARVLRPGGHVVLFWPPVLGSSRLALGPVERLVAAAKGRPFRFFPDELNPLRSRRHAREALRRAGLEPAAIEFPLRLLFIHAVVVGRKPLRP